MAFGMFSRRPRNDTTTTNNTTSDNHHVQDDRKPVVLNMSTRPPFGQWLKATWLDLVTMVIMGVIGLGVYEAHPAPSRSFPVYFQDGEIVYPQFAYPLRNEIIPIWEAALLGSLVPIAVILLVQIRVRSFWDVNNAVIGLLYSLIAAAVFQVFLKWLIGGLRPHFLTVCKPNIPVTTAQETGNGLNMIMYDRTICTGDRDQIDDSLESFPSGHSTAAFAGFVFLYLYLNAKLKVWSNYHPAMWKLIAVYAPILGATLIASALTIDEYHNWYDCLAGAIIGTVMAFSAYRMVYASIWDWRINHIPLNRLVPLEAGAEMELENAVFTRKVGWGAAGDGYGRRGVGGNENIVHGGGIGGNGYGSHGNLASNSYNRKPVAGNVVHGSDDIV
ncbi:Phosphatidate phosphatase/4-nitrophenylphosphatase/Peroxidase [Chlorociboria aeruginascens]|nr:Phosphatidate phosphatase/4-nitrophenylphosphatase/Peroxidase [Chlorociboria aeruginascens]